MTETKEERRARLEAELRAIEEEDREALILEAVKDVSLPDVIGHLVANSTGYPTGADREVHVRAVWQHFGIGEYAPAEDAPAAPDVPAPPPVQYAPPAAPPAEVSGS